MQARIRLPGATVLRARIMLANINAWNVGMCSTHVFHSEKLIATIVPNRTHSLQLLLQRTHRRCLRLFLCGRRPARRGGRPLQIVALAFIPCDLIVFFSFVLLGTTERSKPTALPRKLLKNEPIMAPKFLIDSI